MCCLAKWSPRTDIKGPWVNNTPVFSCPQRDKAWLGETNEQQLSFKLSAARVRLYQVFRYLKDSQGCGGGFGFSSIEHAETESRKTQKYLPTVKEIKVQTRQPTPL